MPTGIPQTLPGRLIDSVLCTLRHLFAPQINLVIDFEHELDRERLRVALRRTLDAEPVLGCRFVPRLIRPHWERLAEDELDRAELLEVAGDEGREAGTQRFLGIDMPDDGGPQLRAWLHRDDAGDRLVLKVHHRAADAGGVKELAYRLAEIYRALEDDPDHRPPMRHGSRSLSQVYRRYVPWGLPGIAWRVVTEIGPWLWPWRSLQYRTAAWDGDPPRFVLQHLDRERVERLAAYGRPRRATLNDLVIAALIRALTSECGWDGRSALRVISTADLRRFLPDGRADAVCNLSGFMLIHLGRELGSTFGDTVGRVAAVTAGLKDRYLGLVYNLLGFVLFGPWPAGLQRRAYLAMLRLEIGSGRMPYLLTNMGPIDEGLLDRFGPPVVHAFLVCPACREGVLGGGISGYRGTLTLSAGAAPSAVPAGALSRLFDRVDGELRDGPDWASTPTWR